MATRKPKQTETDPSAPGVGSLAQKPTRPLIFISHDHRDADLAEAFSNLLTDASGGFLKSFRSSDKKGGAGIEFGAEWYTEIMGKINDATDVVALLTENSVNRPWILYEAGVAKGKLDKPVFGVVVGIELDLATKGPFAQFQNAGDDEESLTKCVWPSDLAPFWPFHLVPPRKDTRVWLRLHPVLRARERSRECCLEGNTVSRRSGSARKTGAALTPSSSPSFPATS